MSPKASILVSVYRIAAKQDPVQLAWMVNQIGELRTARLKNVGRGVRAAQARRFTEAQHS